jgi:hypothetical protein
MKIQYWKCLGILNETHLQPLTMCLWSLFHCRDKESGAMLSTTTNWETKVRWTRMTPCQPPVKAYCSHSALVTAPSTTVRCADRWWGWIVRNQSAVLHLLMRRNHHPVKKTRHQRYCEVTLLSVRGWRLAGRSTHCKNGSSTHPIATIGYSLGVNQFASQPVILLSSRGFFISTSTTMA